MGDASASVVVWLGLGLGLLALVGALAGSSRGRAVAVPRSLLLTVGAVGAALALIAFLATLGHDYPFERGERLGHGFLLGAAAALLTLLVGAAGRADAAALATAAGGSAVAAVSAALLLDRGYPDPIVAGVPFGFGAALLFVAARASGSEFRVPSSADHPQRTADHQGRAPRQVPNSETGTRNLELRAVRGAATYGFLVAAALAMATLLAISRYAEMPRVIRLAVGEKVWWGIPVAFGGALVFGQLASHLAGPRKLGGAIAGALALVVAAILLTLLHGRGALAPASGWGAYGWLLLPLAAGWISALLLAGGVRGAPAQGALALGVRGSQPTDAQAVAEQSGADPNAERRTPSTASREPAALLGMLILVSLLAASYRAPAGALASTRTLAAPAAQRSAMHRAAEEDATQTSGNTTQPTLSGFGVSLAALGFLIAGPWFLGGMNEREVESEGSPAGTVFLIAAATLVVAACFRVFYDQYDLEESGIRLAPHYTLLGIMAGAGAPMALAIGARAVTGSCVRSALARGALTGFIAALVPALLVIFWGIRAGGGLLVGLAAGLGFMLLLSMLEAPTASDFGLRTSGFASSTPVIPAVMIALVTLLALTPLDYYATHWPRSVRAALTAAIVLAIASWSILAARKRN